MPQADTRFTMVALAPFAPVPDGPFRLRLAELDPSAPDALLAELGPTLRIPVPAELCPLGGLDLTLTSRKAFTPEGLVAGNDYLSALARTRQALASGGAKKALEAAPPLPAPLAKALEREARGDSGPAAAPPSPASASALDDILSMVAAPASQPAPAAGPGSRAAALLDETLGGLLALILDHPDFRACEAAFAGLRVLARQGLGKREGASPACPVRVLAGSVSAETLGEALAQLGNLLGETPPGLLVADLPLTAAPVDTERMALALEAADNLLMPTVLWAPPGFLHLPSWEALGKIPYLSGYLEDASFAKWRGLKKLPGASWTALTCGGFAFRPPHAASPGLLARPEGTPPVAAPAWALATLTAASLVRFGLPCRFTDYRQVRLTDLPVIREGATEALFSDDRIHEFVECGITPLAGARGRDDAFLPKEAALDGESFQFRLLLADVLGFLFRCRKEDGPEMESGDLSANLAAALSGFLRARGLPAPQDLEVAPAEGGGLAIGFTLPPSAVPGGQRLEFGFVW